MIPEHRLPLLVTGASGVTGFNAYYYLSHHYPGQVFGQRPVETYRLNDKGILAFNLEDRESTVAILQRHRIRSVLNCGGNCALKSCELDPSMAFRINVEGVSSLIDALQQVDRFDDKIRVVHLSVDLVFSGSKVGGYVESDTPDPVTIYGKTMVAAEAMVQANAPGSCVLRVSLPMGISFNGHAGAIDWIQSRFAAGRPATLYYDEVRTPSYVQCMNLLFEMMLSNDATGIFHAGGSRCLSLYEIAQVINRVGGFDPKLLHGCYRIEAGPMPPRAGNVSMNCEKLNQLLQHEVGQQMVQNVTAFNWPLDHELVPTHRKWHLEPLSSQPVSESERRSRIIEKLYSRPWLARD